MDQVKIQVRRFQREWLKGFTDLQEGYTTDGLPYAIYTTGIKNYKVRCVVNFETLIVPVCPFYPILIKETNVSSWDDAKNEIKRSKERFSQGEYHEFFIFGKARLVRPSLVVELLPKDVTKYPERSLKPGDLIIPDFYTHSHNETGYIYVGNKEIIGRGKTQTIDALKNFPLYLVKYSCIKRSPEKNC
jgi:hypothetical protein